MTLKFYRSPDVRSGRQKPQLQCVANASGTLSLRSGFGFFFVYYPAFRRYRGFMLGYWLPPTPWAQNSARLRLAKVNCEFEKSAQMSHLCRFHPFGVQTCWGGCLPPLSPPTTERASRSLLWIPLCGTAFD